MGFPWRAISAFTFIGLFESGNVSHMRKQKRTYKAQKHTQVKVRNTKTSITDKNYTDNSKNSMIRAIKLWLETFDCCDVSGINCYKEIVIKNEIFTDMLELTVLYLVCLACNEYFVRDLSVLWSRNYVVHCLFGFLTCASMSCLFVCFFFNILLPFNGNLI